MQICWIRPAFFCKPPSIRRKRLVTGRDRFGKCEGTTAVLCHANPDESHDARAFAPGGCRTCIQMRQHIGGDRARSTLAKCGAFNSLSGKSQHARAKGSEEDRGIWSGDVEFGTGGELVADHMSR